MPFAGGCARPEAGVLGPSYVRARASQQHSAHCSSGVGQGCLSLHVRTLAPGRTPLTGAPQAAHGAAAALRVSDVLISPKRAQACVVFGWLASADAPVVGPVSISTAQGVLVTKCDGVLQLWRLLCGTPIFAVVLPDVVIDQLEGTTWLWQGGATEAG